MKACTRCGCGLAYNVPDICLTCRYKTERDEAMALVQNLKGCLSGMLHWTTHDNPKALAECQAEARALLDERGK